MELSRRSYSAGSAQRCLSHAAHRTLTVNHHVRISAPAPEARQFPDPFVAFLSLSRFFPSDSLVRAQALSRRHTPVTAPRAAHQPQHVTHRHAGAAACCQRDLSPESWVATTSVYPCDGRSEHQATESGKCDAQEGAKVLESPAYISNATASGISALTEVTARYS
jgi:hypothetical protein